MNIEEIKTFIKKAQYYTEYLPIIDAKTLKVLAYEANSRFILGTKEVSTNKFFKELHHNSKIFFYLEQRNKKLQIDNCKKEVPLFLHFDSKTVHTKEQRDFWKTFLTPYRENIVIGITENGSVKDSYNANIKSFTKWIKKNNFQSSLNSVVSEGAIFSFKAMQRAKYIKIDRKFIKKVQHNDTYKEFIKQFVLFCNSNKQEVILTNINTDKDLKLAQEMGINLIQGDHFSKESFSA
ncbi:MAG: EAL domain-containing protein [Candidatus Marinarcus sp.]|uniref:EAL domain-containing protein n=1 Tax=Candidatus Marinarcus sp. TaxID=3100987 RepID=UPI003AFFBA71